MLRAYHLVYPCSPHAPQQLWEWQQPHVDHLLVNACTFGRQVAHVSTHKSSGMAHGACFWPHRRVSYPSLMMVHDTWWFDDEG